MKKLRSAKIFANRVKNKKGKKGNLERSQHMTTPVKVYPTSIVSSTPLEPVRDAKYIASSAVVEVLHIVVFAILISAIFGKAWRYAVANEKKAKAMAPEAATQKA